MVRPRRPSDLAACAAVLRTVHERDRYPTYWPADPERFVAGEGTLAAWVAVRGDDVLGHVALAAVAPDHAWPPWLDATGVGAERLGLIARFYVDPGARGTGVADALFHTAVADARARGLSPVLDVAVHNQRGVAFYRRRGWREVGEATLVLRDPPEATLAMLLYVAPDVAALEAVAARAMPASEVAEIGGWLVRATDGVRARRANSVLAVGDDTGCPLGARIDAVERFYAERGLSACFQMTPASRPAELAAALVRRGYARESPTLVQTGSVTDAVAGADGKDLSVTIAAAHDDAWLQTWTAARDAPRSTSAGAIALWRRIAADTAYATVRLQGAPAGTGMAVRDGRFVGIFNMATLPTARRRGVARAALRALAAWAREGGAEHVYLQVEAANDGALALYGSGGLSTAYEYAYLRRALTDDA